jgi:hypothetical protein
MLKPKLPVEQLEKYRDHWTHDTNNAIRQIRWSTETQRALNSGVLNKKKFETTSVRLLPGTPKSYEKFREVLFQKYGILSFVFLKYECYQITRNNDYNNHNTNEVGLADFRNIINTLQLGIKAHDINQMIAYVTPSSTTVPLDKFVYNLKGNVNSFQKEKVNELFGKLVYKYEVTDDKLKLNDLLDSINREQYPEMYEGFSQYVSVYANANSFGKTEFTELMQDLYATSPDLYEETLKSMWIV